MIIALAILLPVAYAFGLMARKPVPAMSSLPAGIGTTVSGVEIPVGMRGDLFSKWPIMVRSFRYREGGPIFVEFHAAENFVKPDLLVYWVGGGATNVAKLPDNAILVGAFHSDAPLPLPSSVTGNGVFVLYSLANNEVVDISKPLPF